MATTQFHSEDVTDLPGFQTFLADRRLARENQIPTSHVGSDASCGTAAGTCGASRPTAS